MQKFAVQVIVCFVKSCLVNRVVWINNQVLTVHCDNQLAHSQGDSVGLEELPSQRKVPIPCNKRSTIKSTRSTF